MLPEFRKPLNWLSFSISGPIIGKQVDVVLLLKTRCHAALITHALILQILKMFLYARFVKDMY